MATRMAMMTMTMRSSMIVKAGVSLLDCLVDSLLVGLVGVLEAVLLCLILVLFIGLILA